MNKFKRLLIPFLILLAVCLGIAYFQTKPTTKEANNQIPSQELKASLSIVLGDETKSYDISTYIGKAALEATQSSVEVETSGTGTNAYVTAINQITANPKKNEFWELIINGKSAEVGAGSYIIKNGDQIQWKINTY